jgi:uncharacterized protein (TIRG00374 family)
MRIRRPSVVFLLKILISVLLVSLVLWKVDVDGIVSSLRQVSWWYVAGAMISFSLSVLVLARRWQTLSFGLLTFRQALKYTWIGLFYGAILPGTFSGDVAKCASLALKHEQTRFVALPVSVAMDRIVGLYTLMILFALSCFLLAQGMCGSAPTLMTLGNSGFVYTTILVVMCTIVAVPRMRRLVGWSILRLPFVRIREALWRFSESAFGLLRQPRIVAHSMCLSFLSHGLNVVYTYFLIRALGVHLSVVSVFVFYSLLSVALIISISYCGIGIRDVVSIGFFQAISEQSPSGVAFSWLSVLVILVMAGVGGIVLAFELGDVKKNPSEWLDWCSRRARKGSTD